MFQPLKKSWPALMLLVLGSQSVFGFSLLGPINEAYQVTTIGYGLGGDIGAPKNVDEEYRRNTRTLYYAFDENFAGYFGTSGMAAVDQAFSTLNNLANLSSYSSDLSEWPLTTSRFNQRARALGLVDLKSDTLSLMMEQLGLAEPDRWTWTLHYRGGDGIPGITCPADRVYLVIMRNLDPVTYTYTPYVNGTLYSYEILEGCTGPDPLAVAQEFPVDITADTFTALAANRIRAGLYFTGLTRDDVGGLRYLMSTNRFHVEAVEPNSLLFSTNGSVNLLVTSNLAVLASQALTNGPVAFQTLYPNIVILSSSQSFTTSISTNISFFFTNSPYGNFGTIVLASNVTYTTSAVPIFSYVFGNVVTNSYSPNGLVTIQTTQRAPATYGSPGTFVTTSSSSTTLSNFVTGEYYIAPSNFCGYNILSNLFTAIIPITNATITATNAFGINNTNQFFTENVITYFTNHNLIYSTPQCISNTVSLREGVDKLNFVRQDFDSIIGGVWTPITNFYTLTAVTNNSTVLQTFRRVLLRPDFLFSAQDLAAGPTGPPGVPANPIVARNIVYNQTQRLAGLAGPGTIEPSTTFLFNKVGPTYLNPGTAFFFPEPLVLNEGTEELWEFIWASFDGTTNAPIIYPSNVSLSSLESQIVLQIVDGIIPNGNVGVGYNHQLTVAGLQAPYAWTLALNSPGLPAGLSLSAGGVISGTPSQPPSVPAIYDFVVQVQETGGLQRVTQKPLTLEIDP